MSELIRNIIRRLVDKREEFLRSGGRSVGNYLICNIGKLAPLLSAIQELHEHSPPEYVRGYLNALEDVLLAAIVVSE